MYADTITDSMREAIDETARRRSIQEAFNREHGIVPKTIKKSITDVASFISEADATLEGKGRSRGDTLGHGAFYSGADGAPTEGVATAEGIADELSQLPPEEVSQVLQALEEEMAEAAARMDFERAAHLRDQVVALRGALEGESADDVIARLKRTDRKASAHATRRRYRKHKK